MNCCRAFVCALLPGLLLFAAGVTSARAQVPGGGWALNWSDEFDGTALDTTKWSISTGARRDAQNVAAAVSVGSGAMTIATYTEGGVHKTGFVGSSGKFDNAFGYWEARVRFTSRDGMWSAFWIQSPTITNTGNNPAANGTEIDVVEHRNKDTGGTTINNRTVSNVHWDGYGADHKSVGSGLVNNPGATALQGNWHTYGLLWEPGINRFYVDGVEVWSQSTAVSHINHFIYLTSEVETGGWAYNIPAGGYGALGAGTNGKMEVDYVRYYSRAERVGNGGWTYRLGNWDQSGNSSWSATGGRSGGGGGRINPQTTAGANFEQTVAGLEPGVPYVLTGYGTVGTAAWPDIRIGVKNYGGAQVFDSLSSTGFTEAEVPFTMGLGNSTARIFAWVPTQYGDAYADDVQVRRAAATMDAGFESGVKDEFWSVYGDTLVHAWTDLELVDDGGLQIVGLRFAGLNIPRGAIITSATIQFKADEVQSGATSLAIGAQAADTAAAFTATAGNLGSRATTGTSVLWQPAAWGTIGEAAAAQRTPNLAALVQEIVSRPGWTSGNAMAFLITGTGHRTAEAFEKAGGAPASLSVTYSVESAASFSQWMSTYPGVTGNNALRTANPDGDAFNNLLEYALATHPAQGNAAPYAVTREGSVLVFTYTRPSVAPDLTFAVEWSATLAAGSWSTAGVTQQIVEDDGTTRTVRAIIPAGTGGLFARLKVTAQ